MNIDGQIKIRVVYSTTKISDFCSVKDKIPEEQKFDAVYKIQCPGCGEEYIGKTNCCFGKRMEEHGTKTDQPMNCHFRECEDFRFITNLNSLPTLGQSDSVDINLNDHFNQAIRNNSKVLRTSRDKLQLSFLETFLIKKHKSKINFGIKAAKELQLF